MTIELLSGQLVAVKTALDQIRRLIEESLQDEQHYQLVMNMDVAINGCNLLIRLLDEQISKLGYDEGEKMTFESKVKLVLESKGTEECLVRLDRQMSALNLIITAYNARSPGRQKEIIEEKKAQKIFDQVKDDSASLYVLCDSASFGTQKTKTTIAKSKWSLNFDFDAELMQHRAYKSTFRSLMRKTLTQHGRNITAIFPERLPKSPKPSEDETEHLDAKPAISRRGERPPYIFGQGVQVLAIGIDAPDFVEEYEIDRYDQEVEAAYLVKIHDSLLPQLQFGMRAVSATHPETAPNPECDHYSRLIASLPEGAVLPDRFDETMVKTMFWCVDHLSRPDVPKRAQSRHFSRRMRCFVEPEYTPTGTDIIISHHPVDGWYQVWLTSTQRRAFNIVVGGP